MAALVLAGIVSGVPGHPALDVDVAAPDKAFCTDENQTPGAGGQHVRCAFTCPDPAGSVSIEVDADDSSAGVSGSASCSDGNAHCSGHNSCSDLDEYVGGAAGTCRGDSDEWVDDGLYVMCSADPEDQGPLDPPINDEWCPLPPYPLCIAPPPSPCLDNGILPRVTYLWVLGGDAVEERCRAESAIVGRVEAHAEPGVHAAHIFSVAGTTIGLSCRGLACVEVDAVCVVDRGLPVPHKTCTV